MLFMILRSVFMMVVLSCECDGDGVVVICGCVVDIAAIAVVDVNYGVDVVGACVVVV